MERWYKGFHATGRKLAMKNIKDFSKRVSYFGLSNLISHVCLESNAFKKGQYYFFIGIESERKDYIPIDVLPQFENLISDMGFQDAGFSGYFDEIESMVDPEIEIERVLQVKTWQPQKKEPIDPYSYIHSDDITSKQVSNLTYKYNQLLYWLSAYGRGTWQQFRSTCEALGLDSDGKSAGRIMRRLRSLGHIELARNGQYWFIAPACFIEIPTESKQYQTILAGQRIPLMIQQMENNSSNSVEFELQPYSNAPEAIRVTFSRKYDAENFIEDFQQHCSIYLVGQASLKIASELSDLSTWEQNLPTLDIVTVYYDYEQWIDGRFQSVISPKETGMYRLTHNAERFEHPQITLYYDANRDDWRKADWYGLRYLMLKRTGRECQFDYNHNLKTLSIDKDVRLPDMYERSLVLASGRLPIYRNEQIIFGAISDDLAHIVAHKLEAELIEFKGI